MNRKQKVVPTSSFGVGARYFQDARNLVREGANLEEPLQSRQKRNLQFVEENLIAMERLSRGEITVEQFSNICEEINARLPGCAIPKPRWLESNLASGLLNSVRRAKEQHPEAAQELLRWLAGEFAPRRGRPVNEELQAIYKQAARMRSTKLKNGQPPSWMQISQKYCPHRHDSDHRCTKDCADRIRMGVQEYLPPSR